MNVYAFRVGREQKAFELRMSRTKGRPVVVVVDADWDYEDCEDAADMSADVAHCRSVREAAEFLGLL